MRELIKLLEVMQGDESELIAFAKGSKESTTIKSDFKKRLKEELKK